MRPIIARKSVCGRAFRLVSNPRRYVLCEVFEGKFFPPLSPVDLSLQPETVKYTIKSYGSFQFVGLIIFVGPPYPIQQGATVEIVMTDNSKTPPAKKTIQDPPEYAAASEDPSQAAPSNSSGTAKPPQPVSQDLRGQLKWNEQRTGETDDWLGGPQNGAEAPGSKESGPTGSGKVQGEGARNPQTGERIARNPQTGE
ncbi:hypothetical protein FHT72_003850 [Rhizobium sp. BK077]|nr:hypothetical protein [Rhizobium sp. BK112]MBB3369348.1 hypothetical protein [Rhizobium sp. BK077]MBB4180107.1 hypothetical protein [Rhizobium sp. BK109]